MILQNFLHLFLLSRIISTCVAESKLPKIVVAGSSNLDTFLHIQRLPNPGENLTLLPGSQPNIDVPGGKGLNQAVACKKLSDFHYHVSFISRLGHADDSIIRNVLHEYDVDSTYCQTDQECKYSTGRGYVFLEKSTGRVSAVVSGGANMYAWSDWENMLSCEGRDDLLSSLLKDTSCILLQCEVPQFVNILIAKEAQRINSLKSSDEEKIIVCLDVGGEDRSIDLELLECCDYVIPNESELKRLIDKNDVFSDEDTSLTIEYAKKLQSLGAKNVLVTLGRKGSLLLRENGNILRMASYPVENVVDETGAGDCYRAGFVVALAHKYNTSSSKDLSDEILMECMKFASAAGALAVTKEGAVPSIPTREEVDKLMQEVNLSFGGSEIALCNFPRGGILDKNTSMILSDNNDFPYLFGSRLNSMKDRPELWSEPVDNVRQWVKRQGTIQGLDCIDFNYPQHFQTWTVAEAKALLIEVGLRAGCVCLRYPSKFARGAMNHPDINLRREAIEMTKKAADVAKELGCNEVVIWSAFDGYDYPFQVNYQHKWNQLVEAFQECCDAHLDIKWSLEYKPTDENTRFFTVPSTGAAMLMVRDVNRENFGLTLDVGHMLMAGENVSFFDQNP